MILGLSGRLFESTGRLPSLEHFLKFASATGYGAVELRGDHFNADASEADAQKVAALLSKYKLRCAFFGAPFPRDETSLLKALHAVDLAVEIGSYGLRCDLRSLDHLDNLRRLADYAAERGVKLFAQLHEGTALPDVYTAAKVLKAVDHPNFGLSLEPSHMLFAGFSGKEEEWVETVRPWLFCVSMQNHKPWMPGLPSKLELGGRAWALALPEDTQGVRWRLVFQALKRLDYKGPVVAMPACFPNVTPEAYAEHYLRIMRKFARA